MRKRKRQQQHSPIQLHNTRQMEPRPARIGHRKSRNGCIRCKQRHVKCDEKRPCSNCRRHEVSCSLELDGPPPHATRTREASIDRIASSRPRSRPTTPAETRLSDVHAQPPTSRAVSAGPRSVVSDGRGYESASRSEGHDAQLFFHEEWMRSLLLLHHYTTQVAPTISRDPTTASLWAITLPESAFSHEYLMHGLLGLSALHYADTHPHHEHEFALISSRYQDAALRYFTAHVNQLSEQNYMPFFFLGTLIFLLTTCSIARPQQIDQPVSPQAIAQSFVLLQGVKNIIYLMPDSIQNQDGPLAPLLQMIQPGEEMPSAGFVVRLEALSSLVREKSPASLDVIDRRTSCLLAIEALRTTHRVCKSDNSGGGFRRVWMWPMTLPSMFIELLRQAEPLALVILAHYAALVRPYEHPHWVSHGWSSNVMKCVTHFLDTDWSRWLNWPQKSLYDKIDVDSMSPECDE